MHSQIYVNLPCADLKRSMAFYRALGYDFNPEFTNDSGACMLVGENIFVMLLQREFFQSFTTKDIVDAKRATEVLICVSCGSREEMDALVAKAVAAGGSAPREPKDHGFMVQHGYEDLDGHVWELVHMVGAPPKQEAGAATPRA